MPASSEPQLALPAQNPMMGMGQIDSNGFLLPGQDMGFAFNPDPSMMMMAAAGQPPMNINLAPPTNGNGHAITAGKCCPASFVPSNLLTMMIR
jgi:hypothetical protein